MNAVKVENTALKTIAAHGALQELGFGTVWAKGDKKRFYINEQIMMSVTSKLNSYGVNPDLYDSGLYIDQLTGNYGFNGEFSESDLRDFEVVIDEAGKWLKENMNKEVLSKRTGSIKKIGNVIHFFKG